MVKILLVLAVFVVVLTKISTNAQTEAYDETDGNDANGTLSTPTTPRNSTRSQNPVESSTEDDARRRGPPRGPPPRGRRPHGPLPGHGAPRGTRPPPPGDSGEIDDQDDDQQGQQKRTNKSSRNRTSRRQREKRFANIGERGSITAKTFANCYSNYGVIRPNGNHIGTTGATVDRIVRGVENVAEVAGETAQVIAASLSNLAGGGLASRRNTNNRNRNRNVLRANNTTRSFI